jgi:hypothetical protein
MVQVFDDEKRRQAPSSCYMNGKHEMPIPSRVGIAALGKMSEMVTLS